MFTQFLKKCPVFTVTALLLVGGMQTSGQEDGKKRTLVKPTPEQIECFRSGDVKAFSDYIEPGTPVILVSVYRREVCVLEKRDGTPTNIVRGHSFARVVQSNTKDFPVNSKVSFWESKEGVDSTELHHFEHPDGQLFYLLTPKVDKATSEGIILLDGQPPVSLQGSFYCPAVYLGTE